MTWIYAYPVWLVAPLVTALACVSAIAMAAATHRFFTRQLHTNDVAGPIAGVVGTILAVLLSFMLVTAWSEYDQAAQTATNEAAAASDLYELAAQFPPAVRLRLRRLLGEYARTVVTREWPLMRVGGASPDAASLGYSLLAPIASWEPATPTGQGLQSQAIALAEEIVDSRRDRLFDNQQGIPAFFYAGIALIVAVTFFMGALFTVHNVRAHYMMAAAVGAVVGIVLVLIAEFDYPFRGDIQIPPSMWWSVLQLTRQVGG